MSRSEPRISLIVAAAENDVIGDGGALPWRLPSELRRFRERTMGHPLIMGRKTFESIGRPLPGRDNIVLTRGGIPPRAGVLPVSTIDEALALAGKLAGERGVNEIFVIGGAEVFGRLRERAERIYLTRVHMKARGDVTFAEPEPGVWRETSRVFHPAEEGDACDYSICVYEREK